jgi:hypothetical protein
LAQNANFSLNFSKCCPQTNFGWPLHPWPIWKLLFISGR